VQFKYSLVVVLFLLLFSGAAFGQTVAPQEKFATIFGAKIRYLEAGSSNSQTLILLHGLGGSADGWQFNIAPLAAKYRVIAPDQIGFGKSDKPLIAYRINTYVDFLDKFMSELKIERATLIGNSMGGWVSALYAVNSPQKIEKLILVDAGGYAPPKDFDLKQIDALNPSTREGTRELVKRVFFNQLLFANNAAVDTFMTARIATSDGYTIQSLIESIKRGEGYFDNQIQNIKQPTLIIWGKQDGLIPLENGERLKREIANSELVVFDQCGHVPQIEKAKDFNETVLKFLEK
jgi:pimeloyl-ACP methyl ester carboxylesterase